MNKDIFIYKRTKTNKRKRTITVTKSISCNHKLNISKPAFSYEIYPILIIATNQLKDVEAYDILIFIKIGIQDYILVGMTLHSENHFILKIFDGKAFFGVDNLNPSIVLFMLQEH
ncbi:hypothetical protein BpHYR1_027115 [Brachionus plicatilis]|uniref:Uncharacterized protein n=1 Tax=Brachionus plicatilis TaxID=10195 RepID=A0A3M7QXI9_BRAPC|nr:hypothetical protein BpHYR1_027115 [Brachionus plicatilis]